MTNKYNLYIGRYQPPHKAHMFLFDQSLSIGESVCIAIRDVQPDEKNPLTAETVKKLWEKVYSDNEKVKVIIIPDISSIKYGRDVGYKIEELKAPTEVQLISATIIRKQIHEGNNEWKKNVSELIHDDIETLLKG